MSVPWFTPQEAGLVGGLLGTAGGFWGAAVRVSSGLLAPRGRGRAWVFGLLGFGAVVGFGLTVAVVVAAFDGQPFHVLHALGLPGVMLMVLGVGGWFLMRHRYRQEEELRMARQDALSP